MATNAVASAAPDVPPEITLDAQSFDSTGEAPPTAAPVRRRRGRPLGGGALSMTPKAIANRERRARKRGDVPASDGAAPATPAASAPRRPATPQTPTTRKQAVEGMAVTIEGVHKMASKFVHPILEINRDEARSIAEPLDGLLQAYGHDMTRHPREIAMFNLLGALANVEGPRIGVLLSEPAGPRERASAPPTAPVIQYPGVVPAGTTPGDGAPIPPPVQFRGGAGNAPPRAPSPEFLLETGVLDDDGGIHLD